MRPERAPDRRELVLLPALSGKVRQDQAGVSIQEREGDGFASGQGDYRRIGGAVRAPSLADSA